MPLAPQSPLSTLCSLPKGYAGAIKDIAATNIKGAEGDIITKSPKLCDTSAPPKTNTSAWIGVIYKDPSANPSLRWAQTGWNKGNVAPTAGEVWVYAEWTQVGEPDNRKIVWWIELTTMNKTRKYKCELTDVSQGKWSFYYDGAHWFTTDPNSTWQSILGNQVQYISEMDHGENDCPGTDSGSGACHFSNLKYLDTAWRNAGLTNANKWVKDINGNDMSAEWGFQLISSTEFKIWDKNMLP